MYPNQQNDNGGINPNANAYHPQGQNQGPNNYQFNDNYNNYQQGGYPQEQQNYYNQAQQWTTPYMNQNRNYDAQYGNNRGGYQGYYNQQQGGANYSNQQQNNYNNYNNTNDSQQDAYAAGSGRGRGYNNKNYSNYGNQQQNNYNNYNNTNDSQQDAYAAGGGRGRGYNNKNYSNYGNQQQNNSYNNRQGTNVNQSQGGASYGAGTGVVPVHYNPTQELPKEKSSTANESAPVTIPKKKGGVTLSLGKKKKEDAEAALKATENPKTEENPTEDSAMEKAEKNKGDEAALEGEKGIQGSNSESTDKTRSKMTPEELREAVRKEILKQREQNKKQFVRDPRPHFNIVFCGHVDAGKSTISGQLLMGKGIVDQREMEKLRREAAVNHREGWEFAYVMDVSEEERSKGITRETGAAYFETESRRVTILDAPGHKAFVPSMIGGATQADVCVLVVSSRTGEFETGFEKGGQTREHAMLVRTCGVKQMICVINKMDEMNWDKARYDEITTKIIPFLRSNGYDEEKARNLIFIPVAGLTGENLLKHTSDDKCPWYKGPTLMEFVDNLVLPDNKSEDDVLCIPLVGSYKDEGRTFVYGKVESGSIAVGEKLQILPSKLEALVEGISIESTEFEKCYPGDNVHLRLRGVDEGDVHGGYIATSVPTSLRAVEYIQARVVVLDVKNIVCAGSRFMIHIHSAQEEASIHSLLATLDRKTNAVLEQNPTHAKAGDVVLARIELDRPLVVETHKDMDKLGRFMLRDDGKTIAIGLVTKLYESTKDSISKKKK